ncbi:MAG: hypothetical protein HON55_00695 [Legionellales bacterium]|nr:hypothetical protein [Legionellales bacterium]
MKNIFTLTALISLIILPQLTVAETDITKKILFKNNTPYSFYFEDKATSEIWEIKASTYEVIALHQNFSDPSEPGTTESNDSQNSNDEINCSNEDDKTPQTTVIEFPHQITIKYLDNNTYFYLNNCMNQSPDKNTIVQVFLGNTGVNCYTSEYNS